MPTLPYAHAATGESAAVIVVPKVLIVSRSIKAIIYVSGSCNVDLSGVVLHIYINSYIYIYRRYIYISL